MNNAHEEIVSYLLKRADESIEDARMVATLHHWNSCANRIYYAAFYAISALLANKGIRTKTHNGLKTKFHQEVILKKQLPLPAGHLFDQLFDMRGDADYGDFIEFAKEEVEPLILETETLINEIKKLIY